MEAVSASKEILLLKSNTIAGGHWAPIMWHIQPKNWCSLSAILLSMNPYWVPLQYYNQHFFFTNTTWYIWKWSATALKIDMEPKKSPDWTGISSSKPPSLCSMSIFRGVSFFSPFGVQLGLLELFPRKMLWLTKVLSQLEVLAQPMSGEAFREIFRFGRDRIHPRKLTAGYPKWWALEMVTPFQNGYLL